MKARLTIKFLVFTAVIILSLIVIGLIFISSPELLSSKSVYQGF